MFFDHFRSFIDKMREREKKGNLFPQDVDLEDSGPLPPSTSPSPSPSLAVAGYARTCELVARRICMRAHWILWILLPSVALQFPSCTARIVWKRCLAFKTRICKRPDARNVSFLRVRGNLRAAAPRSRRLLSSAVRNWAIELARREKKEKEKSFGGGKGFVAIYAKFEF